MILRVRIGLIIAGVLLFAIAQRGGPQWLRWLGMGMVIIALLLRFVRNDSQGSRGS